MSQVFDRASSTSATPSEISQADPIQGLEEDEDAEALDAILIDTLDGLEVLKPEQARILRQGGDPEEVEQLQHDVQPSQAIPSPNILPATSQLPVGDTSSRASVSHNSWLAHRAC